MGWTGKSRKVQPKSVAKHKRKASNLDFKDVGLGGKICEGLFSLFEF